MNLFTKQNETHRHRKQTYSYQGEGRRRDKLGGWDQQIHTAMYKIGNQKDLLCRTRNYKQYFVIAYKGKES